MLKGLLLLLLLLLLLIRWWWWVNWAGKYRLSTLESLQRSLANALICRVRGFIEEDSSKNRKEPHTHTHTHLFNCEAVCVDRFLPSFLRSSSLSVGCPAFIFCTYSKMCPIHLPMNRTIWSNRNEKKRKRQQHDENEIKAEKREIVLKRKKNRRQMRRIFTGTSWRVRIDVEGTHSLGQCHCHAPHNRELDEAK